MLVIVEGHSAGCAPDAEATDADADRRHRPRVFLKLLLVLDSLFEDIVPFFCENPRQLKRPLPCGWHGQKREKHIYRPLLSLCTLL